MKLANKLLGWAGTYGAFVALCFTCEAAMAGCKANLTKKGNFFVGAVYSTWDAFDNVPQELAYTRVYTKLAQEGWKIEQADAKVGIITATTQIAFSGGSAAPLSVIVRQKDAGTKITVTLSIGSGQIASDPSADLCKIAGYAAAD